MAEDRYYDGKTAKAHRPFIHLEGAELVIGTAEVPELDRWPFADIRVIDMNKVTGGMNFGRLSDPTPRLLLLDSPGRRALLAAQPQLASWRQREAKRGFVVGASWTIVGLAIAAIAFFSWQHGSAALAHLVPKKWEKRVGAKIYTAITKNLTVCEGADGKIAMRALVERLAPSGLKQDGVTIDVIDIKLPNALALPGDHVLVTSGLIDLATSPDMLAGVVAHELGHLDLRHPTQSAISNLGVGATFSIILGGSGAGDLASLVTMLSYSRKMEHEADIRGLELLKAAGLRADGMAEFFKVMKKETEKNGDSIIPDWLQSHPGLSERADYTKADTTGNTAMVDTEWQKVKQICKGK